MARSFGAIGLTATDNASLEASFAAIRSYRAAGNTRPIVLDAKLAYIDPIDTSFMPLDEAKFGAATAHGFRKLYHLDDEPTLAQLMESQD